MPRQKKDYVKKSSYVKDWPFIIPGSKAEGNCPGYENCTNWDPGVRKSTEPPKTGYENLLNNSYKRLHGAKIGPQFLKGNYNFLNKFEECNFHDMYSDLYILKYHFHK